MFYRLLFPGYHLIHIEGEGCTKLLAMCAHHKIHLTHLTVLPCDFSRQIMEFVLPVKCFDQFTSLCDKTNTSFTMLSTHGYLHNYQQLRSHTGLWIGSLLAVIFLCFLQSRIWDIQVQGNIYYDAAILQSYLREQNIFPGIGKNGISCIELADRIRENFPQTKWTSVELDGCNLIVHIKENMHKGEVSKEDSLNTDSEFSSIKKDGNGNLICTRDVTIKNLFVRSGVPMAEEGDACKKGDVLVSSSIPIYNDAQEVVRYRMVETDADITVQYNYAYYDEIHRNITKRELTGSKKASFFQFFDVLFTPIIKKYNVNTNTTDTYTEVRQLSITPSLHLPCYYGTQIVYHYKNRKEHLTEKETKTLLNQNFLSFSDDLEKKGVQIYKKNVKMYISGAHGRACGTVSIYENHYKNP